MQLPAQMEFVAFGVTSEVVVVVQDQDACSRPRVVPETRGGEAAYARTDNRKIENFAGFRGTRRGGPEVAVAEFVRVLKRSGMAAAQTGQQRRIVAWPILWPPLGRDPVSSGRANGDRDAIQEVTPMDAAIHAESNVAAGSFHAGPPFRVPAASHFNPPWAGNFTMAIPGARCLTAANSNSGEAPPC
jgi:hypothetical protein